MVSVTHPALVGERHDESLTVSGGGSKDPVKRGPVQLVRVDVGGDGVLESPDTDERVRGQRRKERVQLGVGLLTATAGVDADLGADLIGVDPEEGVGLPLSSR